VPLLPTPFRSLAVLRQGAARVRLACMAKRGAKKDARLEAAERAAMATCHGTDAIESVPHARLVAVAIEAFGGEKDAAFFVESLPPSSRIPRPDLVIAHPDLGVLVIENKGVRLTDIRDVRADELAILRDGEPKWERPFQQAEKVMFRLKDLLTKRCRGQPIAYNRMAALPCIAEADFKRRFGSTWEFSTIFAEAIESAANFRLYVKGFVDHEAPRLFDGSRIGPDAIEELKSIFLGTASLRPPRFATRRKEKVPSNQPLLLGDDIHEKDAAKRTHTSQQAELLKTDPRGGHRLFRGVAGSGKSVILAGMVARTLRRMIEEGPDEPRILVVCFNKTLVRFLEDKIETELARVCWDRRSDKRVSVMHFDRLVALLGRRDQTLRSKFDINHRTERAAQMCQQWDALAADKRDAMQWDAVFVDEAQDLEPKEFELLRRLARPDTRGGESLTIFYDNAQNIYGRRAPTWEHLGINIVGRTTYLDVCLRNTRQTLELAMNVLVGSRAPEGVRAATRQFADLANLKSRGLIDESDDHVTIKFCRREDGRPPVVRTFEDRRAESRWVVREIERLIKHESVQPHDILILYRSNKDFLAHLPFQLGAMAGELKFGVRLVDADHAREKNEALLQPGVLTASTIASAKGYDAPIVFLLGTDRLDVDARGRAQFYVGATRARHLLYITGTKEDRHTLADEAIALVAGTIESH
jgi:hypothetical protein